jgi:holo-ACP synthase CitX
MNNILRARETRAEHIQNLMKDNYNKTVVILKSNVVGANKNPRHMKFICKFFNDIVLNIFKDKIINYGRELSKDGDYCYYVINELGSLVKVRTIEIEEHYQLGRLIDIDVYNEKSISRQDLSCEMRRCLICDNYAHICSRNKVHTEEEIFRKVKTITEDFLETHITNIAVKAIFSELELYPSFGLVSHRDSGSHTDMNYETFIKSTFAIKKYISKYIIAGFEEDIKPLELQKIGLKAEQKMFKATNGINTHKGLIYLLGIFLPAFTKTIVNNENAEYLTKSIECVSEIIVNDYYENIDDKKILSNSDKVYLKYGIKGIRGESLRGLKVIFDAPSFDNLDEDNSHHDCLIYLMSELDDTTIIHKNNLETLNNVKADMKDLITNGGYAKNIEKVKKLSDEYKEKHISPGGSADMLVIKIIYEKLKYLINDK